MLANSPPEWVLAERRALGIRIRRVRERRELSIDQLAEAASLDRKTIMRTELGRHAASIDGLLLIARALDTPLWQLLRD